MNDQLAALRDEFPGFRIWRETIGDRMRYIARGAGLGISPHTVVTDELGNDAIVVRSMTYLCMSWDHRALDGALSAQFLATVKRRLESLSA